MPSFFRSRIFASIWMNNKCKSSVLFLNILIWGSSFQLKDIIWVVKFLICQSFKLNFLFQSFSFVLDSINLFIIFVHLLLKFVIFFHLLYKYYEEQINDSTNLNMKVYIFHRGSETGAFFTVNSLLLFYIDCLSWTSALSYLICRIVLNNLCF